MLTLLSCDNDDYPYADIPSVVLNEFWSHFPDAKDVDFNKIGEDYEVDFELNGNDAGAVITAEGIVIREKKEISFDELPAAVQEALNDLEKNKPGDIEVIQLPEDTYYQIELKRFWFDKKIVFDKTGEENKTLKYWD